jgi:hypothetical protein
MKKFFNKKIGVFILSLLCGVLLSAAPVKSEDEAIKVVKKSIIKHNLGGKSGTKCMKFYIDETEEDFQVDVRSNNEKCGGDPGVEPRMFSYTVNKKNGKLKTDSFEYAKKKGIDWEGDYLPID